MGASGQSIVITGCGWVTPYCAGPMHEVIAASPGVAPPGDQPGWSIPRGDQTEFRDLPPECAQDDLAFAPAAAVRIAQRDAGFGPDSPLPPSGRIGLVLGAALAGQSGMIDFANDVRGQSARFVSPIRFPQTVGNFVAGALARGFEIRGPNLTIANGVASGLDAILEGAAILRAGQADLVYAGGSERWTTALALGLARPGVLLSDGACLFTLERGDDARRRGVPIRAKLMFDSENPTPNAAVELVSCAGVRVPGAVWIEQCVGYCMAALGAAAVASGIKAAAGCPVPHLHTQDAMRTELGSLCRSKETALLKVIVGDGSTETTLRLLVPWDSRS